MQVNSDYKTGECHRDFEEMSSHNDEIINLAKRKIAEPLQVITPRVIKKVKASTSDVQIAFKIPDNLNQGRFLLEIHIQREDSPLNFAYTTKYPAETADITFEFDDGNTTTLHIEKLVEEGVYFEKMFSGLFKETCTNSPIPLKGVNSQRALTIFQYMYSGDNFLTLENLTWVNEFAHVWMIGSLQESCEKFLQQFLRPQKWLELTKFLEHQEKTLVEYLATNGQMLFKSEEIVRLSPRLLMSVLQHPNLTVRDEFKLLQGILKWAKAVCPYQHSLKTFVKQVNYEGKRFIDQVKFENMEADFIIEKVGKLDLFTLDEMRVLSKIETRESCYGKEKRRRNPLNLPLINCSKLKREKTEWIKYFKSAIHFFRVNLSGQEFEIKQGDIKFNLKSVTEDGQFKVSLQKQDGFEDHKVNLELSLINQFDLRKTHTLILDIEENCSLDLFSMDEINGPREGWLIDKGVVIAAKVTYSKLEQEVQ